MRGSVRSCPIQRVVSSMAASSEPITAGVGQDAAEPGVDALDVAELGEIPPGAGECVVGRIFGLLGVAKDEAGQAIGLVQARVDESLECGETRRIGRCRDGPDVLRQPEPLVNRSGSLHLYRRMRGQPHSIYALRIRSRHRVGEHALG